MLFMKASITGKLLSFNALIADTSTIATVCFSDLSDLVSPQKLQKSNISQGSDNDRRYVRSYELSNRPTDVRILLKLITNLKEQKLRQITCPTLEYPQNKTTEIHIFSLTFQPIKQKYYHLITESQF